MFLSTPPSRVATFFCVAIWHSIGFLSTPPSRVATWRYNLFADRDSGFYPRHPRGWRLQNRVVETLNAYVSIHATLAGGDSGSSQRTYRQKEFLSTPPSRVATINGGRNYIRWLRFYPRHPRGWRQDREGKTVRVTEVSIHATLAGGDGLSMY